MHFKTVIFDCDGVLFDSNALKTQAFRNALSAYPRDAIDRFISYHEANGGISRYVKFRFFFENILARNADGRAIEKLLESFGAQCRKLYAEAALTAECEDVLDTLVASDRALFVASGSDEAELKEVFESRGLRARFRDIYGSPKTKSDCIAAVLRDGNRAPHSCIMVGDAAGDWRAATDNGVPCVLMTGYSDAPDKIRQIATIHGVPVIETLAGLFDAMERLAPA